jgi:drug/metabolite transporter (DMT)-like permease
VGLTILLGLGAAVCWGAPDVWLAQATRKLGPLAVVFGSLLIGFVAIAPAAAFVDLPAWSADGVLLAVGVGAMTTLAYLVGFTAFLEGAVAIVIPIVACEGAVAAVIAIAAGERLSPLAAAFLPVAVLCVVLASMGRGGGRAAVLPAVAAALLWGGILVLSAPVADELGVYWAFLIIRASALLFTLPFALARHAALLWTTDWWRVAVWGLGDSAAYLLFVAAADRGPVAVASVLAAQFATVGVIAGVLSGERPLIRQRVGIGLVIIAVTAIAAAGD